MKVVFLIGFAGFLGTLCRYAMTRIAWPASFPYGTLVVNLLGAFLAGFCFIWLQQRFSAYAQYFPILFIGFFGAFTTFSTFALESARFLTAGMTAKFILNVLLQNALGLASAICGLVFARWICSTGL